MKFLALVSLFLLSGTGRLFSQFAGKDSLKNIITPDSVYFNVDTAAQYPNGGKAMNRFIGENIDARIALKNGAPSGTYRIRIACIIDTSGKIIAMAPETNEGFGMEKETMRVLKKFPLFKPAMKNGEPVKSKIVIPVTFMFRKFD
jgi:hypothetical protein